MTKRLIIPIFCSLFFVKTWAKNFSISDITLSNVEILNANTTRIPFKLVGHLIVVEGQLMSQKGNFIIDTGAEKLLLNEVHFGQDNARKPENKVAGVVGELETSMSKRVEAFQLKDLFIEHIDSDIINLSHIERSKNFKLLGIIGYNLLKNYEVFIDLHLNQITLSRVDKKGNRLDKRKFLETITDSLDFKIRRHTIVLSATVHQKKLSFGLDSGAEFNQLNKNVSKKVLTSFQSFRRMFVMGASDKKVEVLVGKFNDVILANGMPLMSMNTILINFTHMQEAYGVYLDGVLGYEFFRQKRTIINYKKKKLYFVEFPY